MSDTKSRIVAVGSPVFDFEFSPHSTVQNGIGKIKTTTNKETGDWNVSIGGGPFNVCRHFKQVGSNAQIEIIPILGEGSLAGAVSHMVKCEFGRAFPVFTPSPVRISSIEAQLTKTNRPALPIERLPKRVAGRIEMARVVFCGPFPSENFELVNNTLLGCRNAFKVLQLSSSQMQDNQQVLDLMSRSNLVALNSNELRLVIPNHSNRLAAMYELHKETGCNILVTDIEQIYLINEGKSYTQFCYQPLGESISSGAGDVTLAAFVENHIQKGKSIERSLFMAAASACRHCSGMKPATDGRLVKWAEKRPYICDARSAS